MSLRDELVAALQAAVTETGGSLGASALAVARYTEEEAGKVARAILDAEPGLDIVRRAALDAVVAYAAVASVGEADKLTARLRGILDVGIRIGSALIAGALGGLPATG